MATIKSAIEKKRQITFHERLQIFSKIRPQIRLRVYSDWAKYFISLKDTDTEQNLVRRSKESCDRLNCLTLFVHLDETA